MTQQLWAKSWDTTRDGRPPSHVFLPRHLDDVYQAALRVLDATGDDQLRAVGLEPGEWRERFRRLVLLAAAVHDLGKANDHFQDMVTKRRDVRVNPQGLRHEWVTVLMLQQLRDWLLPAVAGLEDDFVVVEWAVAGHHPAHNHASPPKSSPVGAGKAIEFLTDAKDFRVALGLIQSRFNLVGQPPSIHDRTRPLIGTKSVFVELAAWQRSALRHWERLRHAPHRLLIAAAKDCLIAADIAGSALPKAMPEHEQAWDWIGDSLSNLPGAGDLQAIVDCRLSGKPPRGFQRSVADSTAPITYVKAGCGTGKTAAAYMWAADNYPTRRLYFCYPTTGTATEGFKDYLFAPESDPEKTPHCERVRAIGAKLFHSRRDVDLEIVLGASGDVEREDVDAAMKLESLEAWSTPVVACTVDTVLGVIQNNRRGLFAWPALAQSAFVFDEIHSYDDCLFGALLRFLRDVPKLPALLMTASLPESRAEALGVVFAARGIPWQPISGPEDLEILPRYRKQDIAGNDPLPTVAEALGSGGKVLWVCNTVERVIRAANSAQQFSPLVYHSRFKYEHRVERHKAVVDAFTAKNDQPALAVCSQVAEMSLDLKGCTLLVTELASVPAMIQRLGRLNRQATKGDPTMPFIVITPDNPLPYTPRDLEFTAQWLTKLPNDGISQRMVAEAWDSAGEEQPAAAGSAWLDGGPSTTVKELRELSPGITVVLEGDLPRLRANPKDIQRMLLPMPPSSLDWQGWRRWRGIPIAPPETVDYDSKRGARWQK
ncbi:MAG TPA: CRISPR-associated helicase Cas3' [Pirellulales bacterium]|nr:CRISPR-associated helicase Cas3' [Pirellulales bacterium]